MKCRVCRQKSVIQLRRHNASFCRSHFIDHIHRQVERTIGEYKMFSPGERLLLGVSGGKDSLALWHILTTLGYQADGVYLHLGIGHYSSQSLSLSQAFARTHHLSLQVVDLPAAYGFSIPRRPLLLVGPHVRPVVSPSVTSSTRWRGRGTTTSW